jgi:GH25 family lysozyme M1 (1,4-beta-N-acetylmuramidase)
MLYGVDVHPRYQAGFNFATLAAQGYTFAAVKATQGTYLSVADFASWISRARAAGMIPGAYHWIVAGDGAAQARYFHDRVTAAGGPEGMLIQLDCEDDATLTDVKAWAAEWERLTGGHPFLIYTGGWWWRPRGWDGNAITPYLWDSHYLTADLDTVPDNPATFAARIPADWWTPGYGKWPAATFLQFTSKGDAGGLGNNVDLNATKLSRAQLLALTTKGDDAVTPAEMAALAKLTKEAVLGDPGMQNMMSRVEATVSLRDPAVTAQPNLLAQAIKAIRDDAKEAAAQANLNGAAITDMGPKLTAILAAALDDDVTVTLPPDVIAALTELRDMIEALPSATETAEAVANEEHERMAG